MNYFLKKEFDFKKKLFLFNFLLLTVISYYYVDILESIFFKQINFIFFYKNIFDVFLTKIFVSFLFSLEIFILIMIIDIFYTFCSSLSYKEYKTYKGFLILGIIGYLVYCIFLQTYFFEMTSLFFLEMTDSKFIYINKLDTIYLVYKINLSCFTLSLILLYIINKRHLQNRNLFYFMLMCIMTLISPPELISFVLNISIVFIILEIFIYKKYILSVLGFEPKTT